MPTGELTWEELVVLEPALAELEADVKLAKDKGGPFFCANNEWYRNGLKKQMSELVGWTSHTKAKRLQTQQAYIVAYDHLYKLLPDCRNCLCFPEDMD